MTFTSTINEINNKEQEVLWQMKQGGNKKLNIWKQIK